MKNRLRPLELDLNNRHNGLQACIHAEKINHYAIASVVVRMEGDDKDDKRLVQFANDLVDSYNVLPNVESRLLRAESALVKAGFTQLETGEWVNTGSQSWPDESRIDAIGQNGGTGEHYCVGSVRKPITATNES